MILWFDLKFVINPFFSNPPKKHWRRLILNWILEDSMGNDVMVIIGTTYCFNICKVLKYHCLYDISLFFRLRISYQGAV